MLMNQAMHDFLERSRQAAVCEVSEDTAVKLENYFRRMMRTRFGIHLDDDVAVGVIVKVVSPATWDVYFQVIPRPDRQMFSVQLLNRCRVIKGRVVLYGKTLTWRAFHGADHRDFSGDFEGAVQYSQGVPIKNH